MKALYFFVLYRIKVHWLVHGVLS